MLNEACDSTLDESTWAGFRSTFQRTRVSTVNPDSLVNMKIGLCSNPNANGMGQNRFLHGHLNAAKSNDLKFKTNWFWGFISIQVSSYPMIW